jgi:hypothetical protein
MCKKIAYVLAILVYFFIFALLLAGCGPVLFTVGGHSVTLGGIVASETVKQVIKHEKKGTSENDERKN